MGEIWKVSQDRDAPDEGKDHFICGQGWTWIDLSWLFYNLRGDLSCDDATRFGECEAAIFRNLADTRDAIWGHSDTKARNAFIRLLTEISAGDIAILYCGMTPRYIGEIPEKHLYICRDDLSFGNGIFPVRFYPIAEVFGSAERITNGSGQGVKGIERYGGDGQFILTKWEAFKKTRGITDVFPVEKLAEYNREFSLRGERIQASKDAILQKYFAERRLKPMKSLLNASKQLVLTGAPGTGKTYTAHELSRWGILGDQPERNLTDAQSRELAIRVQRVQFHPSYDYTDFIEGLKPCIVDGQIGFRLQNGVFKEFCRKAGVIERALFETLRARKDNRVEAADFEKLCLDGFANDGLRSYWESWIQEAVNGGSIELPGFYFIIDEINRADLSRVFGELFYAIEPDYRGPKGAVKTQYSALNTVYTCFVRPADDEFFVPSNVYIIATMNDIDRSVESMDFALRRRFVWKEILADEPCFDRVMNAKATPRSKEAYLRLNKAIAAEQELGIAHQIGPAYFLKLRGDTDEDYKALWDHHLQPILREYLRGRQDEQPILTKFEKAYWGRS